MVFYKGFLNNIAIEILRKVQKSNKKNMNSREEEEEGRRRTATTEEY